MSVNVGEDGRRFIQLEVEVPGSPEAVWQAIATGPGISSWFVPTTVEERVGGTTTAEFGPGMESSSTITAWDPPHRFVKEGDGLSPEAPPVAAEWVVEAKSGGTCLVRVVHSWFASTDEWDGQWEAVEKGWDGFFKILRLALERFPGQASATFGVAGVGSADGPTALATLTGALGITTEVSGAHVASAEGLPTLSGTIVATVHEDEEHMILLADQPGTGIGHLFAMPMGEQVYVSVRFYLFGESAGKTASEAEPEWSRWFAERFPMGE